MLTPAGMKRLGANLRAERKRCGLTQQDVSDDTGISNRSMISNYEAGQHEPFASALFALASCYGVTVESLFVGVEFEAVNVDRAA